MIRVAVLDHTAELGGAELALARLLDHVDREAFDVMVVLFSDGPLVKLLRGAGHRVEVHPLGSGLGTMDRATSGGPAGALAAIRVLPFVARLAHQLRRSGIDVIHTTSLKADLIGVLVAALARRPLVWHVHDRIAPDYLPRHLVRLLRVLARLAPRHVVANSAATAATLPGVRRLTVVHPGLVPAQVAPSPRPAPPGPPTIGIIGRISPTKSQLDFVRAAARVLEACPNVRFRVVGEPSFGHEAYEREVLAEVRRLGLTDLVTFTGFVDDPVAELDRLTVCVHAASVPEPFGQVVAEAMARGTPVVATEGGGVDEILAPGADGTPLGWTVPSRDPEALARAIIDAVTRQDEAARRAAAAHASVHARFAIDRTASAICSVWAEATRS